MKRLLLHAFVIASLGVCGTAFAGRDTWEPAGFRGDWHPVVGSGAVYQYSDGGKDSQEWKIAVVGQEAGGYWVENRMGSGRDETITKILVVQGTPKRAIMKAGKEPAIEMPLNMMGSSAPSTNLKQTATLIGKETISTPAGNFVCDHYQDDDRGNVVDVWVTPKVSPYGLVKMTSKGMNMVLSKVITGATSRITETPQRLDMPEGMPNLSDLMKSMGGADD
ncbi:MAG: hypothetical protein NC819_00960 [Candidatus Omnitrophica bacterium]|nr:hypothetical protein [Candidatus Omnitrophota bacterium]